MLSAGTVCTLPDSSTPHCITLRITEICWIKTRQAKSSEQVQGHRNLFSKGGREEGMSGSLCIGPTQRTLERVHVQFSSQKSREKSSGSREKREIDRLEQDEQVPRAAEQQMVKVLVQGRRAGSPGEVYPTRMFLATD